MHQHFCCISIYQYIPAYIVDHILLKNTNIPAYPSIPHMVSHSIVPFVPCLDPYLHSSIPHVNWLCPHCSRAQCFIRWPSIFQYIPWLQPLVHIPTYQHFPEYVVDHGNALTLCIMYIHPPPYAVNHIPRKKGFDVLTVYSFYKMTQHIWI